MRKVFLLAAFAITLAAGYVVTTGTGGGNAAMAEQASNEPTTYEQVSNCTCKGGCQCATSNGSAMCQARCKK